MTYSIPLSAVGPDLIVRIKGYENADPLRRLVKGCGTVEDIDAAIKFCNDELRGVCYESWGGGVEGEGKHWTTVETSQVRVCRDIISLVGTLLKMKDEPSC